MRIALRAAGLVSIAAGIGIVSGAAGAMFFAALTGGDVLVVPIGLSIVGAAALVAGGVIVWDLARGGFRGRVLSADDVARAFGPIARRAR